MGKPLQELTPEMVPLLQGQTIVLVHVFQKEIERVYTTALSWVFAIDTKTIRFAIDAKSEFITILEKDPHISLTFVGLESVYSVSGKAAVKVRLAEGLTLKMAILEVAVEEVRDIMFYGGKVVSDPSFVKTYNPELAKKLDNEIKELVIHL